MVVEVEDRVIVIVSHDITFERERERERDAPINRFSDGVLATCAAVPRAEETVCVREGVSDIDSV